MIKTLSWLKLKLPHLEKLFKYLEKIPRVVVFCVTVFGRQCKVIFAFFKPKTKSINLMKRNSYNIITNFDTDSKKRYITTIQLYENFKLSCFLFKLGTN